MMIEVSGLSKVFVSGSRRLEVLRDIHLAVPEGQFAAIMGASGSGKSTLLGLLAGLDTATAGSIRIQGEEITRLSEDAMARLRGRTMGYVFQSFHLIPTLTAEENVMLPAELLGAPDPPSRARARQLLAKVGLGDRREHYPVQLSGGEQQRVALARAFMPRPSLLLADEPTGNLDSVNGRQVLDLLLEMNQQQGATLVLVTHDTALATQADRIIEMQDGRIRCDAEAGLRAAT